MGVRTSWLTTATNSDFAWASASASSLAALSAASALRCSVTSVSNRT